MNSKQIEETAVHIVGLYFSNAHTISPYISSNDKEQNKKPMVKS